MTSGQAACQRNDRQGHSPNRKACLEGVGRCPTGYVISWRGGDDLYDDARWEVSSVKRAGRDEKDMEIRRCDQ